MNAIIIHEGNTIMNDIYDAELHPLIHTPIHQTRWYRCLKVFLYIIAIFFIVGFTVTDLVYGYSSTLCVDETTQDMPVPLTVWFIASGYIGCVIIICAIAFGCCIRLPREVHLIINMIPQTIMFSWLIIGNVVYWKDYYGTHRCSDHITIYVMIRIYMGFVLVFASVYHEIKSQD